MPSADDAIGSLYQQAAHIVGSGAGSSSVEHVESAYKTLVTFAHYGDQVSLGLFPLALALLIFHENFQAATTEGRFRVGYVLGRAVAIAVLIHPWTYGRLCSLITFAAGGHGGWLSSDALLGSVTTSVDGLKGAWSDYVGDDPGITDSLSALLQILPLIGIWLVLVCSLLFAYVTGALLSLSQAVLLSLLLAVGKTCLTVTLVPGVSLGGSWARSLAKVAAWSTIAALVTGLMLHAMPDIKDMVRNMSYTRLLRTAGQFIVLAICTLSIPMITEKIFSGAAPAGNAALEALSKGWHGAKGMGRVFSGGAARHEGSFGSSQGTHSGRADRGGGERSTHSEAGRPHKVSPSRLREGLAAIGSLAVAPLAAAAVLVAGREPRRDRRPLPSDRDSRLGMRNRSTAMRASPTWAKNNVSGMLGTSGRRDPEVRDQNRAIPGPIVLARENGGQHELMDRAAVPQGGEARMPASRRTALAEAYPELSVDRGAPKSVGGRDGASIRGTFTAPRELAQNQVQAKTGQARAGGHANGATGSSATSNGGAMATRAAPPPRSAPPAQRAAPSPSVAGSDARPAAQDTARRTRAAEPSEAPPSPTRREVDS